MKYVVRDWLVSEVYEYDTYEEAKKKFDDLVHECKDNECDIQLYQIIGEHISDRQS